MKIYLSGPIRNMPGYNQETFGRAASTLRAEGHEVFNPIENTRKIYGSGVYDNAENFAKIDPRVVFKADLSWLIEHADAIVRLKGYSNSDGANLEVHTARVFGKKLFDMPNPYICPDGLRHAPAPPVATLGAVNPDHVKRQKALDDIEKRVEAIHCCSGPAVTTFEMTLAGCIRDLIPFLR